MSSKKANFHQKNCLFLREGRLVAIHREKVKNQSSFCPNHSNSDTFRFRHFQILTLSDSDTFRFWHFQILIHLFKKRSIASPTDRRSFFSFSDLILCRTYVGKATVRIGPRKKEEEENKEAAASFFSSSDLILWEYKVSAKNYIFLWRGRLYFEKSLREFLVWKIYINYRLAYLPDQKFPQTLLNDYTY